MDWDIPLSRSPTILRIARSARHLRLRPERYLIDFWCLNLYEGEGELEIGGGVFPIRTGHASITVPHTPMEYRYEGPARLTWVHFQPDPAARTVPIPVMQDLGARFELLRRRVEEAIPIFPREPARAAARLWDVLWEVAEAAAPEPEARHPALREALNTIESRLAERLCVAELAGQVGLSQTHLNRLFRAAVGTTVTPYIRRRRVDQAAHLLRHSSLPIKAIAAQVGIPDPHLFNKVIRRTLGVSPKRVRSRRRDRVSE
ncbi:MAG: helix-turn-helix transcriptional regulator [Kiritimatiellae bacterium]|nr:helix-turn-helix transcriptional regulator [Kiritimatiellia bacterium]